MATFAGMMVVQNLLGKTRILLRHAALLLAFGQAAMGVAPLLERGGTSAVAHVEESGTQLHYAHDEADCVACVAYKLAGSMPVSAAPLPAAESLPVGGSAVAVARPRAAESDLHPATGPPLFESSGQRA